VQITVLLRNLHFLVLDWGVSTRIHGALKPLSCGPLAKDFKVLGFSFNHIETFLAFWTDSAEELPILRAGY
jgi:hypothetical protein